MHHGTTKAGVLVGPWDGGSDARRTRASWGLPRPRDAIHVEPLFVRPGSAHRPSPERPAFGRTDPGAARKRSAEGRIHTPSRRRRDRRRWRPRQAACQSELSWRSPMPTRCRRNVVAGIANRGPRRDRQRGIARGPPKNSCVSRGRFKPYCSQAASLSFGRGSKKILTLPGNAPNWRFGATGWSERSSRSAPCRAPERFLRLPRHGRPVWKASPWRHGWLRFSWRNTLANGISPGGPRQAISFHPPNLCRFGNPTAVHDHGCRLTRKRCSATLGYCRRFRASVAGPSATASIRRYISVASRSRGVSAGR